MYCLTVCNHVPDLTKRKKSPLDTIFLDASKGWTLTVSVPYSLSHPNEGKSNGLPGGERGE